MRCRKAENVTRIRINNLDASFKDRISRQQGGEGIKLCYGCGACSASCPIEPLDRRYDPRKIIRMALLGMVSEILESDFIWLCSSCYGCTEVCPQNVRLTEVMFAIKNVAVAEGLAPAGLGMQKKLLREHGRLYEVTEFENEKRDKLGLPPIVEKPDDYEALLKD